MDFRRGRATDDGRVQYAPDSDAEGFYPIEDVVPYPSREGVEVVVDRWVNRDGRCVCLYTEREVPVVRSWTPLSIRRACGDLWPDVASAMRQAGIYDDFIMAQVIREDDPTFMSGVALARGLFGDAAVDRVLAAADPETSAV